MTRGKAVLVAAASVVLLAVVAVLAIVVGPPTTTGTPKAMPVSPGVTARDGAVEGASTAAKALSSVDYGDPEGTVTRMEQVATGPLLDTLRAEHTQRVAQVRQAAAVATGEVLVAAAGSVDPVAGRATVLVLVKVSTTGPPPPKQVRLVLDMTRTPQGWKAAAVSSPPVS